MKRKSPYEIEKDSVDKEFVNNPTFTPSPILNPPPLNLKRKMIMNIKKEERSNLENTVRQKNTRKRGKSITKTPKKKEKK